jgi:plasmid stability protein
MANLQIKGIDDGVYAHLKALAASEHRSVSQQVLFLVRAYLARASHMDQIKTPAEVLLELSGSWEDPREPQEIVEDLRSARKNSKKLMKGF